MRTRGLDSVIRHLRRVVLDSTSDEELLTAITARRDEDAFEVLLRRHGPMVWAICRRVLRHTQDAEDAFQATFLVLIRKACSIRKRTSAASWLHGVALRTARKARTLNARRLVHECAAIRQPAQHHLQDVSDLDFEVSALPEKYRLPVVLCELQGRTRKEAAQLLHIPEGTLSSRLAAARKTLGRRLRSRDSALLAGLPPPRIPVALADSTAQAAKVLMAGGKAAGIVSANALTLTQGVLHSMFLMNLKSIAMTAMILGTLSIGIGRYVQPGAAASAALGPPAQASQEKQVDESNRSAELEKLLAEMQMARALMAESQARFERAKAMYELTMRRQTAVQTPGFTQSIKELAGRFTYRLPVKVGETQFLDDNRIEILEIWGTRPKFQTGGQYLVRARYTMPSCKLGRIHFWETTSVNGGVGPTFDLQSIEVKQGTGEITLLHAMVEPGDFHLNLLAEDGQNKSLANVYFK